MNVSAGNYCQPFPEMALCYMSYLMMFASVYCVSVRSFFVLYETRNLWALLKGVLRRAYHGPWPSHTFERQDKQFYQPGPRCRRIVLA